MIRVMQTCNLDGRRVEVGTLLEETALRPGVLRAGLRTGLLERWEDIAVAVGSPVLLPPGFEMQRVSGEETPAALPETPAAGDGGETELEPAADAGDQHPPPLDVLKVDSLQLSKPLKAKLKAAGLETLAQVDAYATEHQGLAALGFSEQDEEKLKAAMTRLVDQQPK